MHPMLGNNDKHVLFGVFIIVGGQNCSMYTKVKL